jgi:hypothetical protein
MDGMDGMDGMVDFDLDSMWFFVVKTTIWTSPETIHERAAAQKPVRHCTLSETAYPIDSMHASTRFPDPHQ